MHQKFNEVVMQGDIPVNLAVVLVTNVDTGEERYRQWVIDYVETWSVADTRQRWYHSRQRGAQRDRRRNRASGGAVYG